MFMPWAIFESLAPKHVAHATTLGVAHVTKIAPTKTWMHRMLMAKSS
jgi:hypothetical protein